MWIVNQNTITPHVWISRAPKLNHRNGFSATHAAPYAVRAKQGAPVSAPCTWKEIESGAVVPRTFTLRTMPARLADVGDLWSDMRKRGRSLKRATALLRKAIR